MGSTGVHGGDWRRVDDHSSGGNDEVRHLQVIFVYDWVYVISYEL
jgi:hypothetical protein